MVSCIPEEGLYAYVYTIECKKINLSNSLRLLERTGNDDYIIIGQKLNTPRVRTLEMFSQKPLRYIQQIECTQQYTNFNFKLLIFKEKNNYLLVVKIDVITKNIVFEHS